MNAALKICQAMHDAQLPPVVSESAQEVARTEWLYSSVEQLVQFGSIISFQRRMHKPQGVTQQQFALAVDEYLNGRLADCEVNSSALGWLIISARTNTTLALTGPLGMAVSVTTTSQPTGSHFPPRQPNNARM